MRQWSWLKMKYYPVFVLCLVFYNVHGVLYDRANGNELHGKTKNEQCTIDAKPCGLHEDRRIDGTCNNYGVPAGGSSGGPYKRMVTPQTLKPDLPSSRAVRKSILTEEKDNNDHGSLLSSAASSFMDFVDSDISTLDAETDAPEKNHCCDLKDKKDSRCYPVLEFGDDPKSIKDCFEFYKAKTFEDLGCARDYREQINTQTPTLDLSQIYGNDDSSHNSIRKGENGLIYELYKNNTNRRRRRETGNSTNFGSKEICVPSGNGTTCYRFGFPNANKFDLRTTILGIWFIREHNRVAKALSNLNPCWKDDRLFKVARKITIATAAHIFSYELLPLIMGYRNMVNSGLVSESQQIEYVTLYEDAVPLVYAEYEIAMKFFLTLRNGRIMKFDDNNKFTGDLPLNQTLYNHELLERANSFDEISRGMFLQNAAKVDDKLDPEIGEAFYNGSEKTPDLSTGAIQRGRDMGISGYNTYRQICGMAPAKKFEDFSDTMPSEKLEVLKKLYKTVDEVDLLAGLHSESLLPRALVGPTLFCIMAKQMQLFRYSDRHWYERGDQAHSLTIPQLQEIRKANMARLACDNSQAIEFIQPRAFQTIGPGNMPLPCSFISGMDLSPWWDSSCKGNSPRKSPFPRGLDQPYSYMEVLTFFDDMLRHRNMSIF